MENPETPTTSANPAPVAPNNTASLPSEKPVLWNPNVAGIWSLIFTPAFGSYIQMLNWQTLGDEKKAQTSKMWFNISIGFLSLILVSSIFIPEDVGDLALRSIGLVYLIAWYAANGHEQGTYVKETLLNNYVKKPWLKALGFALLGFGAYILAAIFVGIIYGVALLVIGK